MADNFQPTGGPTFRSTDAGGSQHPHAKMEFGGTGVATPVDATNPLPIGLIVPPYRATATFTPQATALAADDVVGPNGAAAAIALANIGPSGGVTQIDDVTLLIPRSSLPSGEANYRLHFFDVTPPSALNDNGAWDLPSGDRASYKGYIDLGTPEDMGSTCFLQVSGCAKKIKLAASSTTLYAYLQSKGAFTQTAVQYALEVIASPVSS